VIPTLVKTPVTLAQKLAVGAVRTGIGASTAILRHVIPFGGSSDDSSDRAPEAKGPGPEAPMSPLVETETSEAAKASEAPAPAEPTISTEPISQPPAPKPEATPGATTTMADPAPATINPATKATAKRATARKTTAKKTPAKKAAPGATAAQKAVAKKTPAKKAAATQPAAVLDEPVAPVEEDTVVYSSGPDVAQTPLADELKDLRPDA
jgi:hypothetical protein